jgi:hypothetical protein
VILYVYSKVYFPAQKFIIMAVSQQTPEQGGIQAFDRGGRAIKAPPQDPLAPSPRPDINIVLPTPPPQPVKEAVDHALQDIEKKSGGNLSAFVNDTAGALASVPGAMSAGLVSGFRSQMAQRIAELELGLTDVTGRRNFWEEVYAWTKYLAGAQGMITLVEQLKEHNFIAPETSPKQAVTEAAIFMKQVMDLRQDMSTEELALARTEQDVLKIELTSMVMQAEMAGQMVVAPFAGMATELLGRMPVQIARELLPGMVSVLKDTLKEGAEIPPTAAVAFFAAPFTALANHIDSEAIKDITAAKATGMFIFALFQLIPLGWIVMANGMPSATPVEKIVTGGAIEILGGVSSAMAGAGIAGMIEKSRQAKNDKGEFVDEKRSQVNQKQPKRGNVIDGEFTVKQ